MSNPPTPVGIAVVEYERRYLVGTRGGDGPLSGCSEFPGGKCHPGESPRDCAVRECREEAGVEIAAERLLLRRTFEYPHVTVDLHFWLCRPARPAEMAEPTGGFRWVPEANLVPLTFPAANAPVIELLTTLPSRPSILKRQALGRGF